MIKTVKEHFGEDARKFKVESTGIKDYEGRMIWKEIGTDNYYAVRNTGRHSCMRTQISVAEKLNDSFVKQYIK